MDLNNNGLGHPLARWAVELLVEPWDMGYLVTLMILDPYLHHFLHYTKVEEDLKLEWWS